MDKNIRVAVLGYGNIGRAAEQAVWASPYMELAGIFQYTQTFSK